MKKIVIISLLILFASSSEAQQQRVFTNFLMNDYYYNPAIAGSKDVHYANLGYRNQWTGFNEAPKTIYANYYGSFKNQMKHGYGVSFHNTRSGLLSNTSFLVNYAYHVKLNDKIKLGMGVKTGFFQYNIKLYDAQVADAGDNILTGTVLSTGALDLSSGLNLYSEKFFVMLSMNHILGDVITFTDFNDGLSQHYTAIAGYKWHVNKPKKAPEGESEETEKKKKIELLPVVMVNYVAPIEPQASFMLKLTYDEKYWIGAMMRTQDAVGLTAGLKIKNRLNIGYAFDYSLGSIKAYNFGSHEIMLSFQTTSKKPTLDELDDDINNGIFEDNKKKKD
jgi:type IX secretion system PorP/SprF family membrane protein